MNKKSFFQCVILLVSFLVLTLAVKSQSDMISYLDNITSAFFQSIRNPDLTNLMTIISTVVSPLTTSLIALVILGYQYFLNQRIAVWLFMLFFGTNALALLLKDIIARHRPMNQLVFDSGYSFPSGHTISTFLLMILVLVVARQRLRRVLSQVVFVIFALVILASVIFSRLYLENHFLTDILGSLLLGASSYYGLSAIVSLKELQ
ncbi:TPA: phosphatase PAP2 family protein [Streptococcus agalactiae]|mgnify:FL=1|uniref:Phosphatase PAP2 family protein n=3 Tax=Streptococcus agalactiae TaxID=1311 RepID=A0AAW3HP70_STRAG|nr:MULTISPECIES: phosphatase PAP2 family protein [Streptococcus]EAO62587.1 PAP2 family protein [Streptococcus agalactiae 18RS21]AIF89465.1 phosphoesterase [Streptococcus agalactiae]ASA99808.1 phosphoesterase [Streptococcus agalactiae]AYZ04487.1 phosphatase PAP2 family protein [Streptococcus sp. FDAARGOS_520]AYZ23526.1 phosphatase PAP2 family protein [Streptococcus agalactiae]